MTEVMSYLNQAFRINNEIGISHKDGESEVREHDMALEDMLSDMKDCPYKDSVWHDIKSKFNPSCDELVDKALMEDNLSYFLLNKKLGKISFSDKDRKQALKNSLQSAQIKICSDSALADRILEGEKSYYRYWNAWKAPDHTYIDYLCVLGELEQQEQETALNYISSELKSCPLEEIDSFSCQALIEEATQAGLSYFQLRHAIQTATAELLKLSSADVTGASEEKSKAKRQVKKP